MTIQAQYWVHEPGQPPAERVTELATPEHVREFVTLLSSETVSDALLTHNQRPRLETLIPDEDDPEAFLTVPDHSVIIGVHGDRRLGVCPAPRGPGPDSDLGPAT